MRILKIAAIAAWSAFATLLVPVTVRAQSPPCTVSLTPSTPSPHLVGELVVWTATAVLSPRRIFSMSGLSLPDFC